MSLSTTENLHPTLNICVLAACPFPANHGTPGSIREFVEALAQRGHQVHLVTYPHGEQIDIKGVHIHRVAGWFGEKRVVVGPTWRKPIYDALMVLEAIRVCWKYDIDIMHAHLYEAALAAWLTRMFTGRRFVYSGHNTMSDELASYDFFPSKRMAHGIAKMLDWFVPRRADWCIPHSDGILTFFKKQGIASRCEPVINLGIDLLDIQRRRANAEQSPFRHLEKPMVVYTGVLDHFQRIDLLLEAMVIVRKTRDDARLVFGMTLEQEDFAAKLKKQAEALGIGDCVEFTERITFDECLGLLDRADIAISPRPQTPGFPMKLLNYWALEKPVVMFDSSASGIEHRRHAWLAENDTPQALAEGIVTLLAKPELRQEIAANGHTFVSEHHNRNRIAERLIDCFVNLLRKTSRWGKISKRPKETSVPSFDESLVDESLVETSLDETPIGIS